jgi:opacity protein-like surface antigen
MCEKEEPMKRAVLFSVLAAVLFSVAAAATTVVYVPMRKSIQMSDLVLVGHVLSLDAAYNKDGDIVTRVTLLVEEGLKGGAGPGEIVTFDAWGGSLDGVHIETVGEAKYKMGDKVLVQLEDVDGALHTLGLSFGKWDIVRDEKNETWAVRSLFDLNMVGLNEAPVTRVRVGTVRELARGAAAY